MPNRVQWEPAYETGHETLDAQHRDLLGRCNALADCLDDPVRENAFQAMFDDLMVRAREHFATEEALLAARKYPLLDDLRNERDEFDYLAAEIVTTENFDKDELQTFLVLWWAGHIAGSAADLRAFLDTPRSA